MPRNMSFALTTEQIKNRTKKVTRRFCWHFLKPGDIVCAVEKAMGLKKGEKVKRLALIRIVSVRHEPVTAIDQADCALEGFPELDPEDFLKLLLDSAPKETIESWVNRIEFDYVDEEQQEG